jgi:dihydroneopterin aldolase/2-amino-4-hydroxy-6-hydroxymethyldihydropteridine diphosphokinase
MRAVTASEYEALRLSDRIELSGVAAEGVHGLYADEALAPQPFTVDVTMWVDMEAAVAGDQLTASIDYVEASQAVREVVETSTVLLVESLAAAVCEALLERPQALAVSVTVHKPRAARDAHATDVRLTMTRTR